MKKELILLSCASLLLFACSPNRHVIKYAKTITQDDAKNKLGVLASDDMQGRETGKPGANKAADYIKDQFQQLGLSAPVNGSHFQMIGLKEKTFSQKSISINGQALEFLKDFYVLPGSFDNTNKTFNNFVFVGYGIQSENYDDLKGLDLNGKVVVMLPGEPKVNGKSLITGTEKSSEWVTVRNKKLNSIKAKNPAAIVMMNADFKMVQANKDYFDHPYMFLGEDKTGNTLLIYASKSSIDNLMGATGQSVDKVINTIKETGKPMSMQFAGNMNVNLQSKLSNVEAKNVLGFLEGSDPKLKEEVLVITAHYDHVGVGEDGDVFNGADDDGSGTTAVLELAEAFSKAKKAGKGPKRSILFMTVVGEEKGLLGSEWYSDHPVFPLKNTITNLNIDMIGRVGDLYKGKADSANYIYVIGSDKLSSTLKEINERNNNTYTKLTLDYKYDDPKDTERIYYRSDHYNFAKHGIPIIFFFNGTHEDYHKKTDEIKKINFDALVKRAQLVFYDAWELANRAERPVVDKTNDMSPDR